MGRLCTNTNIVDDSGKSALIINGVAQNFLGLQEYTFSETIITNMDISRVVSLVRLK